MSLPASSQASSLSFGPCAKGTEFACTTLAVPLDRAGRLPGTITLSIERRLAGIAPSHDAVVALAGGPGQAATPLSEFIAKAIAPALSSRDLLVFDQRGTGSSGALSCVALVNNPSARLSFGEKIEHCARELGPARGDYTTSESVADIEALRQAGGYEKLVLYGTSYGTKVALDYAERYPQNVEALVLDSTETPSGPEAFHLNTFKAMTPALRELCSHGACNGVTKNPGSDLSRLVSQLGTHPLSGSVYLPSGRAVKVRAAASDLYRLLLAGDLNPVVRAEVPAVVHAALNRDPDPLLRLLVLTSGNEEAEALFLATSCEETPFPWARTAPLSTREVEAEAALNALPVSDFSPFNPEAGLLYQTIPLCISWPDAAPPPPAEAPLPDVPTLIFSGGQDLRTPTENAREVAKLIPDAQVLVVPYTGHSVIGSDLSECSHLALSAFFSSAPVSACPVTPDKIPPAPLAPSSLVGVPATHGVDGTPGRALTAAVDSFRDLERTIALLIIDSERLPVGAEFGGLRGGGARITKTAVVLKNYSYIPGMRLSGTISTDLLLKSKGPTATIAVTGSPAASGQLRISTAHHVSGVLDGHAFAVHLKAKAASAPASTEWSWPDVSFPLPALIRPH
jgi:pimeloyl-ACP methyl ester carboxylesterase